MCIRDRGLYSDYISCNQLSVCPCVKSVSYTHLEDEQIDSEKLNEALGPIAEKSNVALIVTDVSGQARIRMRTDIENEELKVRLIGYRMNINQKNSELLSRGNNYELWKAKDHVNQAEYLELWGTFSNGDLFLIRSPLESIRAVSYTHLARI